MAECRRFYIPKATWIFTVNFAERKNNHLLVDKIDELRDAVRCIKQRKPFQINAIVTMPDYLQCPWTGKLTKEIKQQSHQVN
jgi:putative transposase